MSIEPTSAEPNLLDIQSKRVVGIRWIGDRYTTIDRCLDVEWGDAGTSTVACRCTSSDSPVASTCGTILHPDNFRTITH